MKTINLEKTLGPLWSLFSDESVWEIVIDSPTEVFVAKGNGVIEEVRVFENMSELDSLVDRVTEFLNIEKSNQSFSKLLDTYAKITVVQSGIALKGPAIVITKLPKVTPTFDNYLSWNVIDDKGLKIIKDILGSHQGIILAGNQGGGKTTLLNIMLNNIPMPNRIVTLERHPDFIFDRKMVCRLSPENLEVESMIKLIDMAESMRGDYVAISEIVGGEAGHFIEMIRNNCTGIALITGESVQDAIERLVTKTVISSSGLTIEEARYAIAQAFRYLVFQERLENGSRKISSIVELKYDGGEINLIKLYGNTSK